MENKDIKILVAHPGRQHSYRVATALEHYGMLDKYVTTVYNKDSSLLMRICRHILKGDSFNRMMKRRCPDVEDEQVIQINELSGLLLLLIQRLDRTKKLTTWWSDKVSISFQKKLAKYIIENNVRVVISYDTNSSVLFEILEKKAPEVIRIIDNAHPCRNYLYKVYNDKAESNGEFVKTYEACGYLLNKDYAASFGEEAKKAHFHIAASTFSKQAVLYNGFTEDKIIFAPYGVNKKNFRPLKKDYSGTLKVLFVGEINQRKGIYQILEAAKELSNYNIEFNLVGRGGEYCHDLYVPYEKFVNFRGDVSFEDLQLYYGTSHIFVFPSMGEGFGLVLPEALSAGLPIIASRNCAGPDLVKEGYNGFLIDAGDKEQLKEKIMWFYSNMDKLPQMQENAIESIQSLTWENYEKTLVTQLKEKVFPAIG